MPGKWAQKINPAKEVLSYYHTAFAPSSKIAIFLREFSRRWAGFAPALHLIRLASFGTFPSRGRLCFRGIAAFRFPAWLLIHII